MTLRATILDVDGTLAETGEARREAFNRTFNEAGFDWHRTVEDYARRLKTTGGKERMRRYRDHLGTSWPDDDEIAARKPAPDVFLLAVRSLGLSPAEYIAVEDSRNGVLSAHAAG